MSKHTSPALRMTPTQHAAAVAQILSIVDGAIASMISLANKQRLYCSPRSVLETSIRFKYLPHTAKDSTWLTICQSMDALFVRHMRPANAPDDGIDTLRKAGAPLPPPALVPGGTWWGKLTAANHKMHLAKLKDFRALVAAGDIDPNPYTQA